LSEDLKETAAENSNLDETLSSAAVQPGMLYLVGTPIGNLGDLPPRAAAILAGVDLIAAEDTRHTLRLLNHLGLRKRLESYHEHNWQTKTPLLMEQMQLGRSIALVSDAGMPCISDPGADLVRLCALQQIPVTVVPGPCAAIAGLAGSGLPTGRFVFEGFLPAAGKPRKERIREMNGEKRTSILYEAPHRLRRTLNDLAAAGLGPRLLTLARELTKKHEEFIRLTVDAAQELYMKIEPRGEYVLILEGREAWLQRCPPAGPDDGGGSLGKTADDAALAMLREYLAQGLAIKDAMRRCARETGRKKNEIYQLYLQKGKPGLD